MLKNWEHSRNEKTLVGRRRLELPTSRLSGVRSNQLSYRPPYQHINNLVTQPYGAAVEDKREEKRRQRLAVK